MQDHALSVEDAQEVVQAVAALLEREPGFFFLDARSLPCSRARAAQAFEVLLEHYEELRAISPKGFALRGYDETVRLIKTLRVRLEDFKEIDESDRPQVERANALWPEKRSSDAGFAEFFQEFRELIAKYGLA